MADAKISELAAAGALDGSELVEAVQGGVNVQTTTGDIAALGGGGAHIIEDEGTPLTQRTKLNFVGSGVVVTDDSGDDASVVTINSTNLLTYRTETATHDLDATDLASINSGAQLAIRLNIAVAGDLEIPTFANQAFPLGTVIGWEQMGAGQITIVPLSGVTLRSPNAANKSYAQYSSGHIRKVGTNEWVLSGDITV